MSQGKPASTSSPQAFRRPCQPVSTAGKRAGIDDERWLFDDICDLLGRMDPPPRLLIFENVRGLLTANGGDAMGRVVHGLARCGYVGSWRTVRASDVGAPHRRERVFIVATDADDGRLEGHTERYQRTAARVAASQRDDVDRLGGSTPDADGVRLERCRETRHQRTGPTDNRFGPYGPAVERWEQIIGRPAPNPTDERRRLSPAFVEFMMGYPQGWVTDILDRRTDALRCLGNAVVPAQAEHALQLLAATR